MALQVKVPSKFKETFAPRGEVLLPDIRRHVMKEAAIPDVDRDMSFVHPSEMVKEDWCARRAYFRISGAPASSQPSIGFQLANVFENGHSIHDKWQGWLWDMGVLWGKFKCYQCELTFYATSPDVCLYCGDGPLTYKEVPIRSPKHHLIGHADGAVEFEDGPPRLIEIKSIGMGTLRFEATALYDAYMADMKSIDQVWMSISRPFTTHVKQGQIYLATAPMYHPHLADTTEIVFLYEWKPNQQTKEFVVKFNLDIVHDLLEEARSVGVSLRKEGLEPEAPEWAAKEGPICKGCAYYETCYGIEVKEEVKVSAPTVKVKRSKSTSGSRRRKALVNSKT